MRIIKATIPMLESRTLVIGFQAENQRTQVRIDCAPIFAEYPHATPSLAIKPPSGETYPVVVDRDGDEVVWTILSGNLALVGDGELQLTFVKDNVIAKTVIGHIRILRSLVVSGEMPDPVVQWIDRANAKLAEVDAQIVELEGMVDTATDAATRAEQSASTASTKAEQAAGSAATATAKATEAEQSAQTATQKATAAADSERIATAKAVEATTAAGTATAKAEQATEAAQTATEKAADASASATAAQTSATNAASSATAASASETAAKVSETAASTSATQAAQSVLDAGANAQTAMQKAAEATQSATNAAASATSAATSAETASTKAGEAAQSAQAVAETAEQLADSLEQIDQNTQDIAELDERKANIDGYYPDMTVGNAEQLNSSKYVENSEPYTFRTSGGSSDIGNREYLDAVVGGTLAWNQAVRGSASENSTDFAPIVTVTDAVEDAAGVKVKIEPVQDLHGYDHPWPAGGGKNLVDIPDSTTEITAQTEIARVMLKAGTYVLSADLKNTGNGTTGIRIGNSYSTPSVSSSDGWKHVSTSPLVVEEEAYFSIFIYGSTSGYATSYRNIMIESGSTATSYAPYANICPITGFTGVKVQRTGKNLFDIDGTFEFIDCFDNSGQPLKRCGYILKYPAGNYKFSAIKISDDIDSYVYLNIVNEDGSLGGNYAYAFKYFIAGHTINYLLVTLTKGQYFVLYDAQAVAEGSTNFRVKRYNIQVEEGSTATAYEPYAGQVYDITLPTEAGTVYGGELTVNADGSGSLVVDRGIKKLIGTETSHSFYQRKNGDTYFTINGFRNVYFSTSTSEVSTFVSDTHGTNRISADDVYTSDSFYGFYIGNASDRIRACIKGVSNQTQASAWLSDNQPTVVYELATPITYTLTASQIRTLLGTNNVWADTGDLALTYTGTDEHLTLESGKKYLSRISGTDSMLLGSGQEITAAKGTDNVFDLTKMFGTAVADYVYGQGAAFFRKWFGKQWYPYNAGELRHVEGLQSHDMVGFNVFDKSDIKTGVFISDDDGSEISATGAISTGWIPVIGGATYYIKHEATSGNWGAWYDANKAYISGTGKGLRTAPVNAAYLRFTIKNNASSLGSPDTLCINLSHSGSRNGEYEPYEKHSYPLDSTVILRGIPKVGANGVYWDGDRYLPDGTIERRYGVVDLGTLNWSYNISNLGVFSTSSALTSLASRNLVCFKYPTKSGNTASGDITNTGGKWISANIGTGTTGSLPSGVLIIKDNDYTDSATFKAAMSGVLLIYELATPTTETAQPYHSTQWVSDWGTEEFVSTSIVPVGSETRYPANLRDKLQHLPDAASGNGSYLITQTDGQMVLTPFPAPPSSAGNYVLKATVTGGVATYTWEVAT